MVTPFAQMKVVQKPTLLWYYATHLDTSADFLKLEGPAKHSEFELNNIDDAAIQVIFSVYDDILATKNTDFTLKGRVEPSMK